MLTLRLTQYTESQTDRYRVEIALEGDGPRQTTTASFAFRLTAQDQENLRWYLEDYLKYPHDPAPQIATRVERRLVEIGVDLFRKIFQANDDARDLWATLRQDLADTRVEVQTGIAEAAAIPWELLRDPKTDAPLTLRAKAFVRTYSQAAQRPKVPSMGLGSEAIRILLVICRKDDDVVPFRSVATRLIKGLADAEEFQLDVLRPPTFEQLSRVLRQAKAAGQPYHVVHFDGHGTYQEKTQADKEANPLVFSDHCPSKHGYLEFENKAVENNIERVNGTDLGKLLVETEVPLLILNACRSAHAEAPEAPTQVDEATADSTETDPHSQVRAFGSLAQEVMDAGVAGVVAMRYNVYVMTAAQFVAELYSALTQGQPLGEAVTMGRKQLHAQPRREIAYQPIELQDWLVPIVYEAQSIPLFPKPVQPTTSPLKIILDKPMPERGIFDSKLPPQPDVGFFGRDETLLALDRAFDSQSIVLLHAYAGSGKTATAAEFGRWYSLTGGVEGPVLFTSFERYLPLPNVLDKLGQVFEQMLERSGVQWLALSDQQRRQVALQVMEQVPVLWIWDNVEPVAGFPAGTESQWSSQEQQELVDFLRAARQTQAKFLLTSRRDERDWLGELPARIEVPSMPMQERVQLARALADKYGHRLTEVEDWRPLLKFTQGNPLTITVLVGLALRRGMKTREQVDNFVAQLQTGEVELGEQESGGRSESLKASLSYGFAHEFNDQERQQLALLYWFQGWVQISSLQGMADYIIKESPHWVRMSSSGLSDLINQLFLQSFLNLTFEEWKDLLDRAANLGLLSKMRNQVGYYIHPALSLYFRSLVDRYYSSSTLSTPLDQSEGVFCFRQTANEAFVKAMVYMAAHYMTSSASGESRLIHVMELEEANLLRAREIAREQGLWTEVLRLMETLHHIYVNTGRWVEWMRLVDETLPDFLDLSTNESLPGQEEYLPIIIDYRGEIAEHFNQWEEAERLKRIQIDLLRKIVSPIITKLSESRLTSVENSSLSLHYIYCFGHALNDLGLILLAKKKAECFNYFEESLQLFQRIGNKRGEADSAYCFGRAYSDIPEVPNIDKAEQWFRHSINCLKPNDEPYYSRSLGELGWVENEQAQKALRVGKIEKAILHLNKAVQLYTQIINLTPSNAVGRLAVAYAQMAELYAELYAVMVENEECFKLAKLHFQEAIRYAESANYLVLAARCRGNMASCLMINALDRDIINNNVFVKDKEQLRNALDYIKSALDGYETSGAETAEEIQKFQLIKARIEQLIEQGYLTQ